MSSEVLERMLSEFKEETLARTQDASDGNERIKTMECEQCGITRESSSFSDRDDACDECMEDLAICSNCDDLVCDSEVYFGGDDPYCEDCYRELYYYCESCHTDFPKGDGYLHDDEYYCSECFYDQFFTCERCEDTFPTDDGHSNDWGSLLCGECYWEIYTECEDCGEVVDRDYAMYNENSGYTLCESCYESDTSETIKYYDYKPVPNFYGNRIKSDLSQYDDLRYIGVEIEYETKYGKRSETAEIIQEMDADCKMFYQKEDGSLDNGVELVTHPMTVEFHTSEFPWKKILKTLRDAGAKSHDTSTCGYHLHVSRKAFTKSQEIKLAMFVKANQRRIEMFCRRRDNTYARFKESLKPYMALTDAYERREVLNFTNRNTIEFRLPKGTLKLSAVKATIQFYHAMCQYTSETSASMLPSPNKSWTGFVLYVTENTKQYPDLLGYMETRGVA